MKYFLLFLVIIPSLTCAQQEPWQILDDSLYYGCNDPDNHPNICGIVTAFSGLKLRATPSFEGKAIALIPFGELVKRTKKGYDLMEHSVITPDSVRGYWQEITWRGKTGFAFSAYLDTRINKMRDQTYLLFEQDCVVPGYANPSYHYYGIYANRDSSFWEIQAIKPDFIQIYDVPFPPGRNIRANTKKETAFIIASKPPVKPGPLSIYKRNKIVFIPGCLYQKTHIPGTDFTLIAMQKSKQDAELVLVNDKTGKKQFVLSGALYDPVQLVWSGDLDRDGKADFMLKSFAWHDMPYYELYLSGNTMPDGSIKAVKYRFDRCC